MKNGRSFLNFLLIIIIGVGILAKTTAQTTVVIGGGASVTCPATPTATYTTPPSGVSFSNWSRGSGVTCASAGDGISGSGFNSVDAATGYSSNKYYKFSISADASTTFNLSSITWLATVSSGSANFTIKYVNNGGALTDFGTTGQSGSGSSISLTFTGNVTVASSTTIDIYLIPYGTSAPGTTVRFKNNSTVTVTATASGGGSNTISAGSGTEPASISSLTNTQGAASLNFDVAITDDGSTPAADALDTKITQMVFTQGTGNDVTTWTTVIAGAELSDGTNSITGTVNASNITFSGINSATLGLVADNATKSYTLKVWLNTNMGSENITVDGKNLVFRIQQTNITVDNTGSSFASSQDQNSGSTNNAISVVATALAFVQNTSNVNTNASMSPNPTVSANDVNGNRDLDYVNAISITSTGALQGTPVSATPSMGLATFSSLIHTLAQTGRQLTAASTGLTSIVSNTFNIIDASNTTDYFRSNGTGLWSTASTWQSSATGNDPWITATLSPTTTANTITIRSGNIVTISSSVSVDQMVIESGGNIDLSASVTLTVANGTGNDLTVFGTLKSAGTITTTGNIVCESGGVYQHNPSSGAGAIPSITWNTGSTCEILKATTRPTNLTQSYYNFTWNNSSQSTEVNFNGELTSVAGSFRVQNTGSGNLRMVGSSATLTLGGDLIVENGAILNLSGTSSNFIINLSGNCTISGTLTELGSSTDSRIVFSGSSQQLFTVSGSIEGDVNFRVNNSSGVILQSNVTLQSTTTSLTLTSGKLNLNGFTLIVSTISGPTWGANATSYIIPGTGSLQRSISSSSLFPIGTATQYLPCRLTGTGTFNVSIETTSSGLTNYSQALPTQWNINGSGTLAMDLQWPTNIFGTTTDLYKYNGSSWARVGGPVTASGSGPYTASFSGISCCSGFTVGGETALPIELAYLNAKPSSSKVLLDWRTYSENNNAYFSIEKSTDGKTFREIGTIQGNGTSYRINDYSFSDESPAQGNNYYRLKQMDFDGNFEYSKVVSLVFGKGKGQVMLYPTNANESVNILFSSPMEEDGIINVYDYNGKLVKSQRFEYEIERTILQIAELPSGPYIVKVQTGKFLESLRFIRI